jgi:hypothetical protein
VPHAFCLGASFCLVFAKALVAVIKGLTDITDQRHSQTVAEIVAGWMTGQGQ